MVAKGSRETSTLQGLAQSVDPTPGDGNVPIAARRLPHLHKLEK